jgi:hypothetical protein
MNLSRVKQELRIVACQYSFQLSLCIVNSGRVNDVRPPLKSPAQPDQSVVHIM